MTLRMPISMEFEVFDLCVCGHRFDYHTQSGKCGHEDGCADFKEKDYRVMERLDDIEEKLRYLLHEVQELKNGKSR